MIQTMISIQYSRVPQEPQYMMKLSVDQISHSEKGTEVTSFERINAGPMQMQALIRECHRLLQKYPDAKVTMLQKPTRSPEFSSDKPRGYELDANMISLIRDDPDKAEAMFLPISIGPEVKE